MAFTQQKVVWPNTSPQATAGPSPAMAPDLAEEEVVSAPVEEVVAPLPVEEVVAPLPVEEAASAPVEEVVSAPVEEVISETLPPLFSFGDRELFKQKIEELGLEGVTRDVVGFVKEQLPSYKFTYEDLKNGSADILDLINPTELPTSSRSMSDEAILAMFTDVEDYGKYSPPVYVGKDPDGNPIYEEKNYNLSAIADGARKTAVDAGFMTIGGWQGARLGAAAYVSRVPQTGIRPLDVGGKTAAAVLGAVVGAGVLTPVATVVNEWLFDEPDPLVVPSLQAAYNSGETAAYGISFLATPWLGTRLAGKPLGELFNASKTLANFKTIASGNFNPKPMQTMFSKDLVARATNAAKIQASKGPIRAKITPDLTKGPTAARITNTIFRGGQKALEEAAKNPKTFLGVEALVTAGMGIAAYNAEKIAPGNEGVRFGMELASAPVALLTVKPVLGATKALVSVVKSAIEGKTAGTAKGLLTDSVNTEAAKRLTKELMESPEILASEDPSAELKKFLKILLDAPEEGGPQMPSSVLSAAGSPLAPVVARTESQVASRVSDLSVATEKGRERFVADAKQAILALRQTKTPEGMQLAAYFEQRLVEQESIDVLEAGNNKLINATVRLFGNDEVPTQDAELGNKFYDLQLKLVAALKNQSDKFYRAVPDFEVRQFSTADGTEVLQPNSLTIFDVPVSQGGLKFSSKGSESEFNTILGGYKDDFKAMDAYYNPKLDADGNVVGGVAPFPVQFSRLREMQAHFKSLKAARLRVNPMDSMATHLASLSKALNQDMTGMDADGIFLTPAGVLLETDQAAIVAAYTKAKAYTYGMHNVISRTFVSDVAKVNAQRGMVLDPLDAVKAVKKGDDIPLARINQMQAAVNFLRKEAGDVTKISYTNKSTGQRYNDVDFDAEQTGSELNEIFELIIRDGRKNIMDTTVDKTTGDIIRTVNPKKLNEYKKRPNSKALFAIFPVLARDLDSVESAQKLMLEATAQAAALKNTPEQKAFSWFLQRPESATHVIGQIVSGEGKIAPRKALQNMVDRIKNKGSYTDTETGAEYTSEQVLDGLRAAISNYGVTTAGGPGNRFSPTIYYDTLFTDIKSVDATSADGGLRLIDFMKNNGIVDKAYVTNLQKAISQMRNVEEGIANNELSGSLFKRPTLASLGMLRVAGSMLAGASLNRFKSLLGSIGLKNFGVGASITAGEEGSKAATRFVLGPETLVVNNMARILADPKMLEVAIRETRTAQELDDAVTLLQKFLGSQANRVSVKTERDVFAEESFVRPGELGDREADYSKLKLGIPPAPAPAAPVPQQVTPPSNTQGVMNPPDVAPTNVGGPAPSPVPQVPAAPQRPPVTQSGPVDRARFAALFPEDRDLLGIGSLMGGNT